MDAVQLTILSVVPFIIGFFIAWMIWGKYKEKVSGMNDEIRQLKLSVDSLKKNVEDENQAFLDRESQLALMRGQLREKEIEILKLQGLIQENSLEENEGRDSNNNDTQSSKASKKAKGDAHIPKRPGRPPKAAAKKKEALTNESKQNQHKTEKTNATEVKRRPGRPKKKSSENGSVPQPKRRGRPPKVKADEQVKEVVKRGPGSPRKSKEVSAELEKPKRRGRPPKIKE